MSSSDNHMTKETFLKLKRELQQFIPIPQIFSHINTLLITFSPLQFQLAFIQHITRTSSPDHFDSSLLSKLSAYIFKKFDRIYSAAKYAFEDEFLDFFSASTPRGDGKCDRFYELPNDEFIHIRCSESLISDGTTGYSLWEASVALLATLAMIDNEYTPYFSNKRVLELGSGTGLGGLAIAALANPQNIILSDVTQVHDAYTHPNTLLNPLLSSKLDSKVLYWNDLALEAEEHASQYDTVIGCDLVYDPEVCALLFPALKALLNAESSTITSVILFCTLRNPKTFNDFVSDLQKEKNLSVAVKGLSYDPTNRIILNSIESFRIIIINKL